MTLALPSSEWLEGAGARVFRFDLLASTNDQALAMAGEPGMHGVWVTAARQTRGRGRSGRAWEEGPGNLYCSALLRLDCGLETAVQLPIVAGLACRSAISTALLQAGLAAGQDDLKIKWPNDLLLGGRKVAGILAETRTVAGALWCVLGFGINVHSVPDEVRDTATSLSQVGASVEASAMLDVLAADVARAMQVWEGGAGFDRIRDLWLRHAAFLGREVIREEGEQSVSGTFMGLDETGALLLRTKTGIQTISFGDVTALADTSERPPAQ